MPEKVARVEATRRIVAFFYLLTSLVVYPIVLMAAQDLPSLPRVTYSRSLDHVRLTHIPFETIIIGLCFIGIFLVPLWHLLRSSKLELNLMIMLIVAMIAYVASVLIIAHIYPFSNFKNLSVCSDGYPICHPFGVYGYLMFLALTTGIGAARMAKYISSANADATRPSTF
jgi:hypothetical protein